MKLPPLFPEAASTVAAEVDGLYFFLIAVTVVFSALIAVLLVAFGIRYRRRSPGDRPAEIHGSLGLELTWSVIPLLIAVVIFLWGARVFFHLNRPPDDAMTVTVVGKRWMWKLQHPTGQREINQLHVPLGRPVKLVLTSEDVIHSFFVPAFRVKKDAVPGRYNVAWFQATRTGTFHLFCAEYCGTLHSGMIGQIVVLEPEAYQAWLLGGPPPASPVAAGEAVFQELACHTCHRADHGGRGPALGGLYGEDVQLADGRRVRADEGYLRESILAPAAKVVAGYQPVMPSFAGVANEETVFALVAYIRSLPPPVDPGFPGAARPPAARTGDGPAPGPGSQP